MISLIAAVDKNGGIGASGRPLWTSGLPADSQRFRELTAGSTVIMGRKAYESFHGKLTGRQNIVVTHHVYPPEDGVLFATSLDEAYKEATSEDVNVIGGANIFSQAIQDADRIYLTVVDHAFDGVDAYFPHIDRAQWNEIRRENFSAGDGNVFNYSFVVYSRIK